MLYKLDGGIDHILIDEAQDTNPEQWRVIETLAREFLAGEGARDATRTVFAVGDVKQSIFSFQGADPSAFERMREHFGAGVRAAHGRWDEVELGVSFRSTRAVLEAVDRVFAGADARLGVALDGRPIAHRAARDGAGGLVELWPPVEQRPTDAPAPWRPPIDRIPGDDVEARLARLVAARIQRMVRGGETLESRGRPIQARDIMVLVRRRGRFGEELVRALKERGVEVAGVDRMVLTEQMAVMDLIALGRFALMPDDDLMLATVLKGPLIGLGEDDLFALAHRREGRLWDALRRRAGEAPSFADAHARLSHVLARADATPPYEFYAHILGPGGGREKLVGRLGFDAEDPIAEFLDQALVFERSRAPSLEDFLHWLEAGAIEVKRDLEHERRDAVRLMTVHGAKGLQAPIVFLPDTMQVPAKTPRLLWADDSTGSDGAEGPLLWPPSRAAEEQVCAAERGRLADRRDAEYRRLLYVAMTRAEDRLYVCGWSRMRAAPEGCWYNLIRRGLEGAAATEHDEFLARAEEIDAANVLRVTSAQVTPAPETAPQAAAADEETLPSWATRPAPAETAPRRPLAPSVDWGDEPPVLSPLGPDGGARFKRGRVIHTPAPATCRGGPRRARAGGGCVRSPRRACVDAHRAPRDRLGDARGVERPRVRALVRPRLPRRGSAGRYRGRTPGLGAPRQAFGRARDSHGGRLQDRPRAARGRGRGTGGLPPPDGRLSRGPAPDIPRKERALRASVDRRAALDGVAGALARRTASLTATGRLPRFLERRDEDASSARPERCETDTG